MISLNQPLLWQLLDWLPPGHPGRGLAAAALAGDESAQVPLFDCLEEDDVIQSPFEVGRSYLICTATLYYVGRVEEVGFGWVRLSHASWVHWTGRLSTLLRTQNWGDRQRPPRVEPCGEVVIWTQSLVSHYPWTGPLPEEPVQ